MHTNTLNSWGKKTHLLNWQEIDDSTENLSGIIDDHQNYEECECEVEILIGTSKKKEAKIAAQDCKNPDFWYKCKLLAKWAR